MKTAKSALLPSVRVDQVVRDDIEDMLASGENLSMFIELAVVAQVARRRSRQAFLDRGLAAREEARATGIYYTPDFVLGELEEILAKAEAGEGGR